MVAELGEKGCQEATEAALGGILIVKVVVRNQCRLVFSHVLDILNNCRAYRKYKCPIRDRRETTHHRILFPAPAAKSEIELIDRKVKRAKETYDFHGSIIWSRSSSNPVMCFLG